jgi:acetyltransferase-like isoleucine patch superfamily enzyme
MVPLLPRGRRIAGVSEDERLRAQLVTLYTALRGQMRERWARDLPLDELLSDRWERARSLGFGERASIYASSLVYGEVAVGADTWIGPFTLLDGSGGLRIGRNCSISAGVQIYTHDTVKWAVSGGTAPYEQAPVEIGDCCHLGAQAVVARGVTIGPHSVIGACSFVNRDVPAYTVGAGVPCRPIGRVEVADDGSVEIVIDG